MLSVYVASIKEAMLELAKKAFYSSRFMENMAIGILGLRRSP
jgi:hypothetical protein